MSVLQSTWPTFEMAVAADLPSPLDARHVRQLMRQALLLEVTLTPKPGLVDLASNGAHRDMDVPLFIASIDAITPWFEHFFGHGRVSARRPEGKVLAELRPIGQACESAMYCATKGVNCHKGGIFALGLLSCAIGRGIELQLPLTQSFLCQIVSRFCLGIVERELKTNRAPLTVGEHLYHRYQLTGARGEAERGFDTVRKIALPTWQRVRANGASLQMTMLHTLLALMAHNQDTNLVSRGGMSGLRFAQQRAMSLIEADWDYMELLMLDQQFIQRNLSPGGSADLLAVSYVLSHFLP
ncbi:MAG: 2-(5''-triphosphoribosyl)-3'-dephosphocoenzyme-A synthase [Candidatus Celerinatantimonas neptuna]|nr:MAG: 2-(5''-triphosphoribosyl)-3'-dephosphocoenzyme-A synthase [Candidatus Celerinatantimonas neptuna]